MIELIEDDTAPIRLYFHRDGVSLNRQCFGLQENGMEEKKFWELVRERIELDSMYISKC